MRRASSADGGTGRWADALVPAVDELVGEERDAFPFDVRRNESHAIWIEVFVPVDLTVWGFTLPPTASLRSAFGLMWGALPAGHAFLARPELPPDQLWMYQSCMSHGCGGSDTGWPTT